MSEEKTEKSLNKRVLKIWGVATVWPLISLSLFYWLSTQNIGLNNVTGFFVSIFLSFFPSFIAIGSLPFTIKRRLLHGALFLLMYGIIWLVLSLLVSSSIRVG